VCKKPTVLLHDALSLAFSYDSSWSLSDGTDAAITESNWDSYSVRLYQKSSPGREATWFGLSFVAIAGTFAIVFVIQKAFNKTFEPL
jgi:hypothetical protein